MPDIKKNEKRSEQRRLIKKEVVFHTKNDIYMANSYDISETGIRIITKNPIDISFQIKENDKTVHYDAQLVWARVNGEGFMEYGLKYSEPEDK